MLFRYHDTIRPHSFDIFDTIKLFHSLEDDCKIHRQFDTIDEEGIKIELPGVKASDIEVTIENKVLKVTGKTRHGKEFNHVYTIKSSIDDEAITANLQDGLLTISLPKKPEVAPRKISVTS